MGPTRVSSTRLTTIKDEGLSSAACAAVATCEVCAFTSDCGSSVSLVAGAGTGPVASANLDDWASVACGAGANDGGTSGNLGASASAAADGGTSVSAVLAPCATCAVDRCACRGAAVRVLDSCVALF